MCWCYGCKVLCCIIIVHCGLECWAFLIVVVGLTLCHLGDLATCIRVWQSCWCDVSGSELFAFELLDSSIDNWKINNSISLTGSFTILYTSFYSDKPVAVIFTAKTDFAMRISVERTVSSLFISLSVTLMYSEACLLLFSYEILSPHSRDF